MKKLLLSVTALVSGTTFAAPDFSTLTAAVDFSTAEAAVLLVGAGLAVVYITMKGIKLINSNLK